MASKFYLLSSILIHVFSKGICFVEVWCHFHIFSPCQFWLIMRCFLLYSDMCQINNMVDINNMCVINVPGQH